MDVSDVIARREFMPTYIWLDVAFLIGFAALLVWRRKYMMLPVGLVMGGVYFARGLWRVQSADAFTFDQRRQHVLGAAVDERKLWVHELLMAVVVAEPRPPSGGMGDADSRLVVLLPVDVSDVLRPGSRPACSRLSSNARPARTTGGWPSSCRAGVWSVMRCAADRHGYLPIRLGTVEDIRNT